MRKVIFIMFFFFGCTEVKIQRVETLPKYIKKISLATLSDATVYIGLEEKLKEAIIEEFIRDGRLEIVNLGEAQAELRGVITRYVKEPISYDADNLVEEYKLWVWVDFSFRDLTTNKILWTEEKLTGKVRYFIAPKTGQVIETEQEAQEKLVGSLARQILRKTLEGWYLR